MDAEHLRRRIRWTLGLFMAALVVSGLTAVPAQWEVDTLCAWFGAGTATGAAWPALAAWLGRVQAGLATVTRDYPFLYYGLDWLAFAHLVIALAFIGPWRDPGRNAWVVDWGLLACVLVVVMAFTWAPLRGIPPFWRVIDASFGVGGFAVLWFCRRDIRRLAALAQPAGAPAAPPA